MPYSIIDPQEFAVDGMFREADFKRLVEEYDWGRFLSKAVLIKGCGDIIVPPWAFMVITARLVPVAKSVRFGNEHDNAIIFRQPKQE